MRRANKGIGLNRRVLLAYFIGVLPTSFLRVLLYRLFYRYRIRGARIGWFTVICVSDADLDRCSIGWNNRFIGPMRVRIGRGAQIGGGNTFICGWWTEQEQNRQGGYDRRLEIGEDVHVTSAHHFDVAGSLTLGAGSWVAGLGSQFWTHGAGVRERNIRIGERCYIGSAVRFAPGTSVGDRNIVGLGSVVTQSFPVTHSLIGGVPAKVLVSNLDWEARKEFWRQAATPEPRDVGPNTLDPQE